MNYTTFFYKALVRAFLFFSFSALANLLLKFMSGQSSQSVSTFNQLAGVIDKVKVGI